MARYQVKPREDANGPYRRSHVVKRNSALRQGSIYRHLGDDLTPTTLPNLSTFATNQVLICGGWHEFHRGISKLCLSWR